MKFILRLERKRKCYVKCNLNIVSCIYDCWLYFVVRNSLLFFSKHFENGTMIMKFIWMQPVPVLSSYSLYGFNLLNHCTNLPAGRISFHNNCLQQCLSTIVVHISLTRRVNSHYTGGIVIHWQCIFDFFSVNEKINRKPDFTIRKINELVNRGQWPKIGAKSSCNMCRKPEKTLI